MEFHPTANIFPLMQPDEYEGLKHDIAQNGLQEAVWLHPDGRIIDGRNRWQACDELGIKPRFRTWDGNGSLITFVVSLNLHRRHLSASQRAAVGVEIEPMYAEEARERQGKRTDLNIKEKIPESLRGQARDQAAKAVGVNGHYIQDAKKIAAEKPELFDQIKQGKVNIPQAKKKMKKEANERDAQERAAKIYPGLPCQLITGDFQIECDNLDPDSIDVIITDPPYPRDYLPLYGTLAEQAARLLKPGGSLLAMCGQSYLPEVFNLMTPHLNYQWTLSYLTPGGQSPQIWQRNVNTFWKPVLWFVKGKYDGRWHGDVIKSDVNDNDKQHHHWGQSESGMARLVDEYSKPGDLILDPFNGGGTTGYVALAMNRRYIGIDIDEAAINSTKRRMGNAE